MGLGTWIMRLVAGAGAVAGVAVALLYIFQEKLLYVPKIPGVPDDYSIPPERFGFEAEDITLTASDGVKIHAWMLLMKKWNTEYLRTRPVILFFQENAGSMSFRLPFLRIMALRLDCPILAVSYRGYGLSSGRPNEAGLKKDALAGLEYLKTRHDVDSSRVIVYGRSLGGAVALHLVAAHPEKVVALIVENTFTSVENMVSRVVPPLAYVIGPGKPLNFLVTNKWYNNREITKIKDTPILMIVSELDEMVPASQMYELYNLQHAKNCQIAQIAGAHHMDAYDVSPDEYWGVVKEFVGKYVERKEGKL